MKKYHSFGKSAIPALLVTMLIGTTLGCSEAPQDDPSLRSIAVTSPPTKTVYIRGETLAISGLVVTGTYTDGTTRTETVSISDVSGYNANTPGTQTLTVTINGKIATFTVTVNPATLQSIAVTGPPTKTVYVKGEALSISGLVVTGTYTDGTTRTETVNLSNVSGYNMNTLGTQTLTVTISGKIATFTVTVNNAVLQSITVTSQPTKTVYAVDEALDISGLVVTGIYSDGTTKTEIVSISNVSGYNANSVGQQTLIVTVGGKTATFTVTVNAVLQSIAITSPPTKTVYEQGESLYISGLVVTGTYSDGTTKTETAGISNISGYDANSVGQQTLTVTVGGKTATFTVTVNAVLQSIAVTSPPTKTVYVKGETLDISGLVVTGTYSDDTTQTETVSLSNISGYNGNIVGQQTVTVTVDGKTATFTVSVNVSAGFAVNLEDSLAGLPEAPVLSKSGAPASLTLTISGAYASYQWFLNAAETPVSTSASYTLHAANYRLGGNSLLVEVRTHDGVYYSKEITFTVIR